MRLLLTAALAIGLAFPTAAQTQGGGGSAPMGSAGQGATAGALAAIAQAATGCNDVTKYVTGTGTCVTPAAGYSAPTLGSTLIPSGATVTTIAGLTLTAPAIGAATGTSLALGGATIGGNALAVTGTANFGGNLTIPNGTDGGSGTGGFNFAAGPLIHADSNDVFINPTTANQNHEFQLNYSTGVLVQPITGAQSVFFGDTIGIGYATTEAYIGPHGGAGGGHLIDLTDGTTAVGLEVVNTATSTTNYESGLFDWTTTANTLTIGTQKGSGGGSARAVSLVTGGTEALNLGTTQNVTFGAQMINAHLTTGTNADTVCLKADGTFLIQAAACTISSMRFKNFIGGYDSALPSISRLEPIVFTMKQDERPNQDPNYDNPQIGLSAENVAKIEPRCAIYEDDGVTPKSYRQECLIAVLVAAVKEQQQEIASLRQERISR